MAAAAVVRPALDDAGAAAAEDAGPGRGQPGQVGADQVVGVGRVGELQPLAGEVRAAPPRAGPPGTRRATAASVDGRTGRLGGMRLGVLDVGSNTVHLLVVDAHRGAHPTPMHDDRALLRLAEHVDDDDRLSKAGEKALVRAVQKARDQAEEQGCEQLLALVTSAIRDATNGLEVLDRVRERTGVELEVLTGEDEARLTFLAVRRWFGWSAGRLLVLDIGGGSLELAGGIDEEPDVASRCPGRRADDPPVPPGRAQRRPARPRRAGGARRARDALLEPVAERSWRRPVRRTSWRRRARRSARWPGSPGPRPTRPDCACRASSRPRPGPAGRLRVPDRGRCAGRAPRRVARPRAPGSRGCGRGCRRDACAGRTVRADLPVGSP